MKVRATAFGEYLRKRKPGDEFEFKGKPSGKWMEPVDDDAREAFKKAGIKVVPKPTLPPSLPGGKTTLAGVAVARGKAPRAESDVTGGSTGDEDVI